MSADPAMIKNGITISNVTYEEATELAFFGAQVLHPNAMDPAKKKDIPIRILCTHHPEEKGTRIGKPDISNKRPVTSITFGAGVTLIRSEPAEERCSFAFLETS